MFPLCLFWRECFCQSGPNRLGVLHIVWERNFGLRDRPQWVSVRGWGRHASIGGGGQVPPAVKLDCSSRLRDWMPLVWRRLAGTASLQIREHLSHPVACQLPFLPRYVHDGNHHDPDDDDACKRHQGDHLNAASVRRGLRFTHLVLRLRLSFQTHEYSQVSRVRQVLLVQLRSCFNSGVVVVRVVIVVQTVVVFVKPDRTRGGWGRGSHWGCGRRAHDFNSWAVIGVTVRHAAFPTWGTAEVAWLEIMVDLALHSAGWATNPDHFFLGAALHIHVHLLLEPRTDPAVLAVASNWATFKMKTELMQVQPDQLDCLHQASNTTFHRVYPVTQRELKFFTTSVQAREMNETNLSTKISSAR